MFVVLRNSETSFTDDSTVCIGGLHLDRVRHLGLTLRYISLLRISMPGTYLKINAGRSL